MSAREVIGAISQLTVQGDVLAAIGVRLGIDESETAVDPQIVAALDDVLAAAGITSLDDLSPELRAGLREGVHSFFRQAAALFETPAQAPGWSSTDPLVLDGQGRPSMVIPSLIAGAAPELGAVGSFLDVGVGAGWLAIAASEVWPRCTVVGIDPWEPAVELARRNVRNAGLEGRITVRNQDIADLDDVEVYDCAWVPGPFLSASVLNAAIPRVFAALRPGGWIVLGRYQPTPDSLAETTMTWRTLRDGGSCLDVDASAELLRAVGCTHVRPLHRNWAAAVAFVIGQKPSPHDETEGRSDTAPAGFDLSDA